MTLIEQLNEGIKESMRSKSQLRLEVLRMLKSKILTVDARGNLPDADVIKLFKTYCGSLQEAFEQAKGANRADIYEKLEQEIAIVREFLPKALSAEETKQLLEQAIASTGAKTKKEFGLVMKAVMQLNSSVDGKLAKELANELLTDA